MHRDWIEAQGFMANKLCMKGNEILIFSQILYDINRQGYCIQTVAEIASFYNLNEATVSKIINNFVEGGVLTRETGFIEGSRGRRCMYTLTDFSEGILEGGGIYDKVHRPRK